MKPPGKKEILLAFLERGIAMLHLDARRPGVAVPPQHEGDPHLRINLSYRYGIPDLLIDDAQVRATLSFGGRPFTCILPWSAVFGITSQTSGDGQVWPEDLPTEVMSSLTSETKRGAEKVRPPKRARPALVAVQSDPDESEIEPKPSAEPGLKLAPREKETEEEPKEKPGARAADSKAADDEKDPPPNDEPPKKGHLRLIR